MEVNTRKKGIEGLKSTTDEGNQGPDSDLNERDREQLVELLEDGAQAHGWETSISTLLIPLLLVPTKSRNRYANKGQTIFSAIKY